MEGQRCEREGCSRAARQQCPKCLELRLAPSFFCSQECFRGAWGAHKAKHAASPEQLQQQLAAALGRAQAEALAASAAPGRVMPGVVSARRAVPADIARPDYAEGGRPLSELAARQAHEVPVLRGDELATMREVCRLGREVLDIVHRAVRPGVTTDELDAIVHAATIERGCYPSPLNYCNFPKSCCTSVNEVICHGIPDSRPLVEGDIVNLDISLYKHGFHADLNETFYVGKVDEASKRLVRCAYDCLMESIKQVRPGMLYRDVGAIISKVAQARGFSVVRSYCGHGIGRLFHGDPSIPHYAKNKAVGVMKPGHVFTIEPMINEGTWRDTTWPDGWTSVTQDLKRSAQFEHTMVVTETGVEVLTARLPDSPDLECLVDPPSNI